MIPPAPAVNRVRRTRPRPPRHRVPGLSLAFIALNLVLAAIAFPCVPVQEPHSTATVELAAARDPIDWDDKDSIVTIDDNPAATLLFDPDTGTAKVCDTDGDKYYARGKVSIGDKVLFLLWAYQRFTCSKGVRIDGYRKSDLDQYEFEVCPVEDKDPEEKFCNSSSSWPKMEKEPPKKDPCRLIRGKARDYCENGDDAKGHPRVPCDIRSPIECLTGRDDEGPIDENEPNLPEGVRKRSFQDFQKRSNKVLKDRPDEKLPHTHARGAEEVARPIGVLASWVTWFSLAGCVLGFMLVGGKMTISHQRGEAGAHATGFFWVMVGSIIAGTSITIGLISFVVSP